MNNPKLDSIPKDFLDLLASGRSLIQVHTFEEDRLGGLLAELAQQRDMPLWTWQSNRGLIGPDGPVEGGRGAEDALRLLAELDRPTIAWLKDFHRHYSPEAVRGLRDLYYAWRDRGGVAVVSAAERAIPLDLEREMAYFRLDMPSSREMAAAIDAWFDETGFETGIPRKAIAATLKGLTLSEARHSLNRVKTMTADDADVLRALQEEKRRLIAKIGTVEYIPEVPGVDDLGGLENLKDWLLKRRELVISDDEADREITPKGLLLMGVSGCGKSLCIKAISSAWRLPLYRIEMTRIFSGAFGPAEMAFSEACRLMENMAPAVLWIDEIEMSLSAEGSTAADSVLSRIFAFFLTWMQEKPPGLFVAATANRIDLLPAEMIRKGRFDQVFFVDLPRVGEREAIFRIHLAKRGVDPNAFTPEVFADATEGWSGAEIEQCVIAAVTSARMERRELELKDLYAARKQIVPISTTMEEQVRHIRNWAYERAVRASAEA